MRRCTSSRSPLLVCPCPVAVPRLGSTSTCHCPFITPASRSGLLNGSAF
jgi:ferredoxin-thioredoxin reductase catalytic subunit